MPNIVYIAASIDGYIADKNGNLGWLQSVPNPEDIDFGFTEFMMGVDALLMGRKTFETVCRFKGEWPYAKPVFVLSSTLRDIPKKTKGLAFIINSPLREAITTINEKGFSRLYIDGGKTIQSCFGENLVDEIIIFRIPTLLGGGAPLFKTLPKQIMLKHVNTELFLNEIVKSHYIIKK